MARSDGDTWYVVADGGKARILTRDGEAMRTVQHFDAAGHGDAAADAAGEVSQIKAPKSDPNQQVKAHFAHEVAARINEAVRTNRVASVVLAAPAPVLHEIREKLDKKATGALEKSLSKDLTNIPDHDLASHF